MIYPPTPETERYYRERANLSRTYNWLTIITITVIGGIAVCSCGAFLAVTLGFCGTLTAVISGIPTPMP